jgi:hypothetical protein
MAYKKKLKDDQDALELSESKAAQGTFLIA